MTIWKLPWFWHSAGARLAFGMGEDTISAAAAALVISTYPLLCAC